MQRTGKSQGVIGRAVVGVFVLVLAAGALAAVALALGFGKRTPLNLEELTGIAEVNATSAKASADPEIDPFAWRPERRQELERRAALGSSHVIYELSPGGVVATAERVSEFRPQIEAAADRHDLDPDVIEAMIFLESAGRPDITAGTSPDSAAGLGQILPSTATDLLGMEVDLAASIDLTEQIGKADKPAQAERLLAERRQVDQRFDPEAAIEGTATYLDIATERFGTTDLAIESYHMGIGNLETIIRSYLDADDETPVGELVATNDLSFAQLFFDSSPQKHPKTYETLAGLGDDSSLYLWKVSASRNMLELHRDDPDALAETARLATSKATLEEVFHPEEETEVFEDAGEIEDAINDGELAPLPDSRELGWIPDRDVGELADELGEDPALYRALRPEALATLSYIAGLVENASGSTKPLRITSAVRDREYQELLVQSNAEATQEYSLHTTGWSFDVLRKYENAAQAEAFQFALDRLSELALIDYAVEPGAIHVTVSDLGAKLVGG